MAQISYNNLGRSESDNNVSKKDKAQVLNINRLKLKINETYNKDEKKTTAFEPSNDLDVVNRAFLDKKTIQKRRSHIISRKKL